MKLLNSINSKYFVAIDVETVRIEEHYTDLSEECKSAWSYKNKHEGVVPSAQQLSELWTNTAALYAEFSKVCAVSLCFLDNTETKLLVKKFYGDDEVVILKGLAGFLDRIWSKDQGYRLVGHAAKYFDYPVLCKRYIINDMELPMILDTGHLKPWENKNLCTNQDIWKFGGTGPGSSLQALCTALGIPMSKVDLAGDEVGVAYFNKEYSRIGRYCSLDTIATFNIPRKIKREKIFAFDEVVYLGEEQEEVKIPILQKLYATQQLTDDIKDELSKLLKKKKLLKKDKEAVKTILFSHYVTRLDKAADRINKEKEISEFINSL